MVRILGCREPDISVEGDTRGIYHLLCRAFRQRIAIPQIIDLDVADVVAVCNVHLTVDRASAVSAALSSRRSRLS